MTTTPQRVTIEGHDDPNLNGEITFHIPHLMENVRIQQRIAALAKPITFEDMPPEGRALVRLIATLEHVIDTAPSGWYVNRDGRPVLSFEHLSSVDEGLLWRVFTAWNEAVIRFRTGRGGRVAGHEEGPSDASGVPGGASDSA